MSLTGNWSYPTNIKFGAGRIAELPDACAATGMKKPLLVTDKGLADLPITKATLDIMEAAGLGRGLFADVDPNPNEKNLDAGVAAYKAGGHDGGDRIWRRLRPGPGQDGRLHGRAVPARVGF